MLHVSELSMHLSVGLNQLMQYHFLLFDLLLAAVALAYQLVVLPLILQVA